MSDGALRQIDAFTTPGTLLKTARQARRMTEREAADRLNFMPDYVGILERDDYGELRSPAFARGYVRSYARLLDLDEAEILALFDEQQHTLHSPKRIETRPLQLQHTGLGAIIGLGVLLILVAALWWWRGGSDSAALEGVGSRSDVSLTNDIAQMDPLDEIDSQIDTERDWKQEQI